MVAERLLFFRLLRPELGSAQSVIRPVTDVTAAARDGSADLAVVRPVVASTTAGRDRITEVTAERPRDAVLTVER